ncbi:SocA family protein [Chroococcidiopsis sp. FACHB-1243]|uniref:Panacea domain-containing protein n=1 Tax=Chroococcidiopsis sp. [FACHB-1243] TaxID=2692781 RepID=UPI00177B2761|nr:type II toxin-antitoxin system antitoxin SocA domain-containing protein [Chroococcidiopsis sp. [FACHB-1243]]MBD2305686.1 SocA family protein [Chroococcidiopsis sp. [FACHB-1243]]
MLTCRDIAKYFLAQEDEDAGDLISNLKLQKLVYYAQGFHLALYDEPLFSERIEAWTHGPVVPELYRDYKEIGANGIPCPDDIDFSIYDEKTRSLLDEVYCVFGQFSAWKLRNMTHEEAPWKDVSVPGGEITQSAMKEYFKTQLNHSVTV